MMSGIPVINPPGSGDPIACYANVGFQENEVATFAASLNGEPDTTTKYQATIDWGGAGTGGATTSTGDVVFLGTNGSFAEYMVKGSFNYQNANSDYRITVTISGGGTATAPTLTDAASVSQMPSGIPGVPPLALPTNPAAPESVALQLGSGNPIASYAGVGFQQNEVATLSASVNGQPDTALADFSAQINWGDSNSWDTGKLVYMGTNGTYAQYIIKGSHPYQQPATDTPIVVYVNGPDGTSVSGRTDSASVSAMPSGIPGVPPATLPKNPVAPENVVLQLGSGNPIASYAGVGFQENVVATLLASVNGKPDTSLADFAAQINWGDSSTWDTGDLVYMGTNGTFADYLIKGTHIYQQTSSDTPVVVYVNGPDGTSVSSLTDSASVTAMPSGIPGEAPAAPGHVAAPENVSIQLGSGDPILTTAGAAVENNVVATFMASVNGQPDPKLADFQAQINWGDDAAWDAQTTLEYLGNNGSYAEFEVLGSHTYDQADIDVPIVVYVNGPDGTSVSDQTDTSNIGPSVTNNNVNLGSLTQTEWTYDAPAYNGTIAVSGGTGDYSNLQVASGQLPPGLTASLSGSTISIAGTPTQAGTFKFGLSLQDSDGNQGSGSYTLTIAKAVPAVSVADSSGTYTDSAFTAITAGLEGVTPTLTYYSGASATGTALSGAPTIVGTYTVLASFAGSADYTTGSASTTFTIGRAAPTVKVMDSGGTYQGTAFAATDTVAGVGAQSTAAASLEGVTPTLAYYSGATAAGTALSGAPSAAGTYTVLASFAGSQDYTSGTASATFAIALTTTAPSSSVTTLPARTSQTSFTVSWSGTAGSGGPIASYDIYVSTNGGAFTAWQTNTTATSATFTGKIGDTYGFASQAFDAAGNAEPIHATADTTVTLTAMPWHNSTNPMDVLGQGGPIVALDALVIINYLNLHPGSSNLPVAAPAGSGYLDVLGNNTVSPADALAVINFVNDHGVGYTAAAPDVTASAPPALGSPGASTAGDLTANVVVPLPPLAQPGAGTAGAGGLPVVSPAVVASGLGSGLSNGAATAVAPAGAADGDDSDPSISAPATPTSSESVVTPTSTASGNSGKTSSNGSQALVVDLLMADSAAHWWSD